MTASFWEGLIFYMDAGYAGLLELPDCTEGIQLIAVAIVSIGDHRLIDRVSHSASIGDHLAHRDQPIIGIA